MLLSSLVAVVLVKRRHLKVSMEWVMWVARGLSHKGKARMLGTFCLKAKVERRLVWALVLVK